MKARVLRLHSEHSAMFGARAHSAILAFPGMGDNRLVEMPVSVYDAVLLAKRLMGRGPVWVRIEIEHEP